MKTPSPSLAIAFAALLVALGGTGYAVSQLPKNSVGTPQLKSDAVTSAKVKDGSLLARDFKAGQLARGERGPQGEAGPAGATGATGPQGPSEAITGTRVSIVTITSAIVPGDVVARLSLGAGSWVATATTTLENQDGAVVTTAACRLTVGDQSAEAWTRLGTVNSSGFRETVSLTTPATLVSPGDATLQCASSGVTVRAQYTRITAIKVGSLTDAGVLPNT